MKGMSNSKPAAKKGNKGEVLQAIGGFNRSMLKKAVTVDKSKPVRTAEIEEGTVEDPPQ